MHTMKTNKNQPETRPSGHCLARLVSKYVTPYSKGRGAKNRGDSVKTNPYPIWRDEHWEWLSGFWGY